MTYRHHMAELVSQNGHGAIYRFTPDSIKMASWGRVTFSLTDYTATVHAYAKDPDHSKDRQDTICHALAWKFRKYMENNGGELPTILEFVA